MDGDSGAGVIDKQLLAGPVFLPQDDFLPPQPAAVEIAEPAIAIAIRVLIPVLIPEKLQGDVLVVLQLLADGGVVWFR
jgi:hypothetical protein